MLMDVCYKHKGTYGCMLCALCFSARPPLCICTLAASLLHHLNPEKVMSLYSTVGPDYEQVGAGSRWPDKHMVALLHLQCCNAWACCYGLLRRNSASGYSQHTCEHSVTLVQLCYI